MKITPLTAGNMDLLHAIADAPGSIAVVAERLGGKDRSNTRKTILTLRDAGFVTPDIALTEQGRALTRILDETGELLIAGDDVLRRHDQLAPDPDNERKHFDREDQATLKASLLTRGQLQEIPIRAGAPGAPDVLVFGESRWRAIGDAIAEGLWPAERPLRCRMVSEADALQLTLTRMAENLHRAGLHPLDEGAGYVRMRDRFGLKPAQIAAEVGRSEKHVADYIRLVEQLPEAVKALMYLPKDDARHCSYADARRIVQGQNAKPKAAVDVDAREALVLLEIGDRCATQPSHDALAHGQGGWTRIETDPGDSVAALSLQAKGLVEFTASQTTPCVYYVRLAPEKKAELDIWKRDNHPSPALWHARAVVLGAGIAADLERSAWSGRYATPWLNDPLPPSEPAAPLPPHSGAASPSLAPLPGAGEGEADEDDARHIEQIERVTAMPPREDDPEIPDYLRRLAGARERGSDPAFLPRPAEDGSGGPAQPVAGAPQPPALFPAPLFPDPVFPDPVFPDLTPAQQKILRDVAAQIALSPTPGPLHPETQAPAYVGAHAWAIHKDATALELVHHRLLKVGPDARRSTVMVAALTPLAEAWLAAHPAAPDPITTPWLQPPAATPQPPLIPAQAGTQERAAGGSDSSGGEPIAYWAKPLIPPPWELICGHCEQTFELSHEFNDEAGLDAGEPAHRFVCMIDGERAQCPHCQAQLRIPRVEVRFTDDQGACL